MGDLGYERIEADFYATEEKWTKAILPFVIARAGDKGLVWEPSAGEGDMSRVLEAAGLTVSATDLLDRNVPGIKGGLDFFNFADWKDGGGFKEYLIVTNPPYSCAEKYIRHAIGLTRPRKGAVFMFLRNEYDMAKSRIDLFNKEPFAMKICTTGRPRWIKGSTGSPRHCYAWYVWDHKHVGPPKILYV